MTDLIAYDATDPGNIPADAAVILYYGDGKYEWTSDSLARFPKARRRAITVEGDPACNIADVEHGDMKPSDVPAFLAAWWQEHPGGSRGTVYCTRSTLVAVQAICAGREFNVWLATLDGSQPRSIDPPGTLVAVQYAGGVTAEYDTSIVWDRSWPRRP
jgi:hypothetical protein